MTNKLIVTSAFLLTATFASGTRAETATPEVAQTPFRPPVPARTFGDDGVVALGLVLSAQGSTMKPGDSSWSSKNGTVIGSYFLGGGTSLSLGLSHDRSDAEESGYHHHDRMYGLEVGAGRRVATLGPVSLWPRLALHAAHGTSERGDLSETIKRMGADLSLSVVLHPFRFLFVEAGPTVSVAYNTSSSNSGYHAFLWQRLGAGLWL